MENYGLAAGFMNWDATIESLDGGRTRRFVVRRRHRPVSYAEVLGAWKEDEEFRSYFVSLLVDVPLVAYRWETPPVTEGTIGRAFEFVLIDAPGLARTPEPNVFDEQFRGVDEPVISFANLGGDAVLIVPRQMAVPSAYAHLASFVRQAPRSQVHALLQLIGSAMTSRIGSSPLWLSTAGMGVAWLHVRIDSRPKYYGHVPYTRC
jgi:hypothetical protein